ncbi:MAG: ABC transporter ATP-binding protein [Alphaproteobacteria bacterium]
MNPNRIQLRNVDLHYAATAYRERSIKSLMLGLIRKRRAPRIADIHALKDITLEIGQGARVGLMGHNGSGKSTFLKTVAGLYPISGGRLEVSGKISALFDLGLGFEPEATGRENILFRGLLLGHTPAYMRAREAEIVDFAGLGEFIDYPMKTYSAGMQVRLAFAISTAVGGDILLLDEVIGAGDASFMAKAKARIAELIARSDILVLASHDLATLASLCTRGLVFHHGSLIFDGPVEQAIAAYKTANGLPP